MRKNSSQVEVVLELWEPIKYNVFRLVNSVTDDIHLTEDILQESLIIVLNKYHTLRDKSKFTPWVYKIARRIAFKMIKDKNKYVFVDEIYDSTVFKQNGNLLVNETLLNVEKKDDFFDIIKLLTQRERHLFHLRYVQDLKVKDIAVMTGIKLGTLKCIYHRAHKKLYDSLSEEI